MGVFSKHIIEVETIFVTKGGKKVQESEKTIESLGRGVSRTTTQMAKYDAKGNAMLTTTEKNTRGLQRFQMEHLGVMFAGMALNRAMANLNSTAREWTGMNELMSTAMGVVMLPATMDLMNLGIIPLFDVLTNLPDPAKKAIGGVSLALEGLGGVAMVGGQLALGLSSTLLVIEKMGGAAAAAKLALMGLAGVSIIGIGVTLGIASIMAEDGTTALIYALGSGIAVALGAPLLGASAATGITLGAIVVAGLITWRISSKMEEEISEIREKGGLNKLQEQVLDFAERRLTLFGRAKQQVSFSGKLFDNFSTDSSLISGNNIKNNSSTPIVNITQQNTITGFNMADVQKAINKNNQQLTSEVRRIVKT